MLCVTSLQVVYPETGVVSLEPCEDEPAGVGRKIESVVRTRRADELLRFPATAYPLELHQGAFDDGVDQPTCLRGRKFKLSRELVRRYGAEQGACFSAKRQAGRIEAL